MIGQLAVLFSVLVLMFTMCDQPALAQHKWEPLAATISKSVVFVQGGGACTGFVVNANAKGGKDYVLTAAHCHEAGKEIFADSSTARVIFKDLKKDLLILEVDDLDRPAVTFAPANPQQGEEVGSFGHGYGYEQAQFRHAYVSHAAITIPEIEGGPVVMIDAGYVNGQSGGPCINSKGEVVSIVQRASNLVGVGIGAEAIAGKVARFLEKPKP
jgi:S1-C subfamily serine protease